MPCEELITRFHKILTDSSDIGLRLRGFSSLIDSMLYEHADDSNFERRLLIDEYNTWMLFIQLSLINEFPRQYKSLGKSVLHEISQEFMNDRLFLAKLCMLTWVESIKRTENYQEKDAEFLNTAAKIKANGLNERLDPDFVWNTSRKPDKGDVESDLQLIRDTFSLIRAGDLKSAQTLLNDSNQAWRALTLSGLLPYFDFKIHEYPGDSYIPSFFNTADFEKATVEPESPQGYQGDFGNANIELYIATNWKLSEEKKRINFESYSYERALYGSMCGNYEAMLPVCKNDIHDHFWAMIRSVFIFDLREKLRNCNEPNYVVEEIFSEEYGEFGLPINIPNKWPSSFDGILRMLQQQHAEVFKKSYNKLQFTSIVPAILSNWDQVLDNLSFFTSQYYENSKEGVMEEIYATRFSAHLAIIIKSAYDVSENKIQLAEELISKYIKALIGYKSPLHVVLFYLRYISDETLMMEISNELFRNYTETHEREMCVESLKVYASKMYQGFICEIIMNIVELKYLQLDYNNVINMLRVSESYEADKDLQDLISLIKPQIFRESFSSLLSLIRKLILSCKINKAHELVVVSFNALLDDNLQKYEREYWSKFIDSINNYINYKTYKSQDFVAMVEEESFNTSSSALLKVSSNPIHAIEKRNNQIKNNAEKTLSSLEFVTGIKDRRFPLIDIDEEDIRIFTKNWEIILLLWMVEIYEELRMVEKCKELLAIVESIFERYLDGNQKAQIVGQLRRAINRLSA
ncbi:unnamed protein product [Blepharisma stoltei]|uniref:Nuclear pore complex protein n=1 Tax=Blepharisma stoltei TaxID=1481888 RepID=A0AAU9JKE0_9CILI|nr:unnamed protein product [Blepharisma stoltei]